MEGLEAPVVQNLWPWAGLTLYTLGIGMDDSRFGHTNGPAPVSMRGRQTSRLSAKRRWSD